MTIYSIIPCPEDDDPLWSEVVQRHNTSRHNLAGTHCIVKWTGETPKHLPDGAPLYYHPIDAPKDTSAYAGDILTAIDSKEWTETPST